MASFAQEPKNAQPGKRKGRPLKTLPANPSPNSESQNPELVPLAGAQRFGHDFGRVSVHSGCSCGVCDRCKRKLYRKAADAVETGPVSDETTPQVDATLGAPGRPLDAAARSYFEPRFGHDFSRVRIHVDDEAAGSVQAHAFTIGEHIVFAANRYTPSTHAGRQLLAHELTHVVQQSNPGSSGATRSLEAEAHAAGQRVSGGHAVSITGATGSGGLQRDEDDDAAAADVHVIAKDNGRVAVVLVRKGKIVQGYAEIKPPPGMSATDAASKIQLRVHAAGGNGLPKVDVFVPAEWGRQPVNPAAKVEVKDNDALNAVLEREKRDAERQEKVRQIRELYRQYLEDYSYQAEKFGDAYAGSRTASGDYNDYKTDDQILDLMSDNFFFEWLQRRQKKRDFQEFKRRANEAGYEDPEGVKEMYKEYRSPGPLRPGVDAQQVHEKELHDLKYDPAHALEKGYASPLLLQWMASNPEPIDTVSDSGPAKMYALPLSDGNIAMLTPAEYAKLRQTAKNTIETQLNTIQNRKNLYQGVKQDRDRDPDYQNLDMLFGAELEGKNWKKIDDLVQAGRDALKSGDLKGSLKYIEEAEKEGAIATKEYNRFLHNREVGGEVTLQGLEIVKTGSEVVLAIGTIPLGGEGLVIVTGKGVTESLALAAVKQAGGQNVDWKDVGFDVGTQVVTALAMHGLNKVQALGPNNAIMKAFRESYGAQLSADVMQSVLLDSATYSAKRAYEEARGRGEKFTAQDYLKHVQTYLSDPTGLPLDVIKAQMMRHGGELLGTPGAHGEGKETPAAKKTPAEHGAAPAPEKSAEPAKPGAPEKAPAEHGAAPAPEKSAEPAKRGAPEKASVEPGASPAPEKATLRIEVSGTGHESGKKPAAHEGGAPGVDSKAAEGGTRDRDVYRVPVEAQTTKKGEVDAKRINKDVSLMAESDKFARESGDALVPGTTITVPRGAKPGELHLSIESAAKTDAPISVTVNVEAAAPTDPMWKAASGGPHEGEGGPARLLSLTKSPTGEWTARVVVHQGLHSEDVPLVLQHEFNEISDILARNPHATQAEIARETEASMFRGGPSDGAAATAGDPAKATAHDRAAARELAAMYRDLANAREAHKPKQDVIADKQARLDRMVRSMGLEDPRAVTGPMRDELKANGVPPELLTDIDAAGSKGRETGNYGKKITGFREAQPMMSAAEGVTPPGHFSSKHGGAKAKALEILNSPERVFTGKYEHTGRRVDIYYREGNVVITEAGQKDVVITGYGPEIDTRKKGGTVDPGDWAKDPGYTEIPLK